MENFREIIRAAMAKRGVGPTELARMVGGRPTRESIHRYLRGDRDMCGDHIAAILAAMRVQVVS